ncbi:unnamed protein product, partial [Closterium sp. NIES-53]
LSAWRLLAPPHTLGIAAPSAPAASLSASASHAVACSFFPCDAAAAPTSTTNTTTATLATSTTNTTIATTAATTATATTTTAGSSLRCLHRRLSLHHQQPHHLTKQLHQHHSHQQRSLHYHHRNHPAQQHVLPHQHQQRRSMFIQTLTTPNPASLMFNPGRPILSSPPPSTSSSPSTSSPSEDQPLSQSSIEFSSARAALASPLAIALFRIDGVARVFLGGDFVTVTKTEESSWDLLKPEIFAALMDFFASGQPVLNPQTEAAAAGGEQQPAEDESETVLMIRELLETRIRPAVQEDGGDIDFVDFDEATGIVYLRMKGACSGCPSSSVTLKSGVENMLTHYIPE